MTKYSWLVTGLMLSAASGLAYAGDLEPPGPPASTMKTLTEVEPRTAIHAADLPLEIAEPGSYYLAENVSTAGGGITISANDVSIDLMGFALADGTGPGITTDGTIKNIEVRNGTVSGWSSSGLDLFDADNVLVRDLRAQGNQSIGIALGDGSVVLQSVVEGNGGNGLHVGSNSIVTGVASRDNAGNGIVAGSRSVTSDCVAYSNDLNGIVGSLFSQITDSVAANNGSDGIRFGSAGARVAGNSVSNNSGDGIQVFSNSAVVGNTLYGHNAANAAGIRVTGDDNRIDGNLVNNNLTGVLVEAGEFGNLIAKNSAAGNTTNFDVPGGNFITVAANPALAGAWSNLDLP